MRKIIVERIARTPVSSQKLEIVERKGQGHPDYIIDSCSEAVSLALCRYYLDNFQRILHHNVDKGLLVAGVAEPKFGGGKVIEPISITVAGRAITKVGNEEIPIDDIVRNAIKTRLKKLLRFLDVNKHVTIDYRIRPGSIDLIGVFEAKEKIPLANDTSVGLAFAPMTITEKLTYSIERFLNSRDFKRKYPMIGEDIKVMSVRENENVRITIAMPQIDRFVHNISEYTAIKEEVRQKVLDYIFRIENLDVNVNVVINTADNVEKGIIYLTVTGTSAECGDDGNTGRGNRVNGLITPNRPMSMEAIAGKNPVNHVGKIYNILAKKISDRIVEEIEGIDEVYVRILSSIGVPIDQPQVVSIQIISRKESIEEMMFRRAREIANEELNRIVEITDLVVNEKIVLF